MKKARILLADDHKVVAEGLTSLLETEFDLVGAVADGRALVDAARRHAPDVIVADIEMPLMDGFEAARQIRKERPATKIVFLSFHDEPDHVIEAFRSGASGYLLKSCSFQEMVKAIREVIAGRRYITPLAAEVMPVLVPKKPSEELTARQRHVVELIAEGLRSKRPLRG